MIKIYCDKCKEEIKTSFLRGIGKEYLEPIEVNNDEYFLCPECYNNFTKWLNEMIQ